jgi:adenine-specific DNA-methyltransferase
MKSALHLQLHQPSDNRTVVSGREVTGLRFSRAMARAWSQAVPERQRQQAAWAFIKAAMDEYIEVVSHNAPAPIRTSPPRIAVRFPLDRTVMELARTVGREAAELPIEQAAYQVSATYTVLVPSTVRSQLGMYYTPLALTRRLLDMADEAGIDWKAARVLDPACGGGAFLLPVALRMREALAYLPAAQRFHKITTQLRGLEIDPFAAWLTQTWLEIALADLMNAAREPLPSFVQVCDALDQQPDETLFDLVIGNPPYGRVSLSAQQRQRFKRCLFGHANLYGVFTDIALRWAKPEGVIAYVTPTSFLAGEYFKGLRSLLATEAPPVAIGFINARWGVFEDVLQEALLATYRRGSICNGTPVHYLAITSDHSASVITNAGRFTVPPVPARPWLVPRLPEHQELICRLAAMPHRLKDWGYEVSTGPLVWNRFKDQLRDRPGPDTFPPRAASCIARKNGGISRISGQHQRMNG